MNIKNKSLDIFPKIMKFLDTIDIEEQNTKAVVDLDGDDMIIIDFKFGNKYKTITIKER